MTEILKQGDTIIFISQDGTNCIVGKIESVADQGDKLRVDYRIVGVTDKFGNKDLNKSCIAEIPKPRGIGE